MSKVRVSRSNGGEFDGNAPALDMDYSEAIGKYLQGPVPHSTRIPILGSILDLLSNGR